MTPFGGPIAGNRLLVQRGTECGEAAQCMMMVILADDFGYGSLNSYGASEHHVKTPSIDRLALEGRRFTDANTPASVCTPSRYGLLTGRYCWRSSLQHGVLGITSPLLIETDRLTIGSLLQSVGYRTAAIGKWHLGYGTGKTDYTKPLDPGPLDIGFDYHFGVPQNHGDAIGWLENQNAGTPFFLYFTLVAIHFPYTPSSRTRGTSGVGLNGDWIHEPDRSVGRITKALDRLGFAEDTLLIFTSDNGGVVITDGDRLEAVAYRAGFRANGDWRGRKHSIYEGGFRVPFIVRWPGRVGAGTTCDETINLVDLLATTAAVVGEPLPPASEAAEDSFDVLPAFLGRSSPRPLRRSMIVQSVDGNLAIRRGPWRYIEGKASPTVKRVSRPDELRRQLYDLTSDPAESNDQIDASPEVAARLDDLLDTIRARGRSRGPAAAE